MNLSSFICTSCLCFLALQGTIISQEKLLSPQEQYFLKRITEYWKDKDYDLVKAQIIEFLETHGESQAADNLLAILGDLYYEEGNFSEALSAYRKIQRDEFKEKTLYKQVRCLDEANDKEGIVAIAGPFFHDEKKPKIEQLDEVQYALASVYFEKMQKSESVSDQEKYAALAKPLYIDLTSARCREAATFPLAEIHKVLREYPQACALYEIVAEKNPAQSEELLMLIASLQLTFDKDKAIETYGRVYQREGDQAAVAAYNQFVLLYQENRFSDLIDHSGSIAARISPEKAPLFHFCLGCAHFDLAQYGDASSFFEQYVKEERVNSDQKKSALLTLISCAQKMNDADLFDRTLTDLLETFPQDPETAKALLLHAQVSLKKENLAQAATDLNLIIEKFPSIEQRETILYDRALLLTQTKHWAESREAFLFFLDQFPNSSSTDVIWGYVLNCSIQELKEATPETVQAKKVQFAQDLTTALTRESIFTAEERSNYQFLLGKTFYELEKYEEAISSLEMAIASWPSHVSVSEAHLLLSLCYRESGTRLEQFVSHSEKALQMQAPFIDPTALHLQLYNAYLSMGKLENAADHLFACYITENHPIQQDNQLWLANFYYREAKEKQRYKERAIACFQKILGIQSDQMNCSISAETPFLEAEALKLAELLPLDKRLLLLSSLSNVQEMAPKTAWKFQRQVLFDLAKAYEAELDKDKALKIYEKLIDTSSHAPSYYSCAAQLERARLLNSQFKDSERTEKNPKFTALLNSLKDLQIQKRFYSEPIHLEAALEYADIRIKMASAESRMETALFFLGRVKEDFSSLDDTTSVEYHEARQQAPEKDALFQNYMKCIEAEMLRLESQIALKEKKMDKAYQAASTAEALFAELLASPQITPYLRMRAELNLKNMVK